ncbi:ABC transporter permease [Virgibacillus flavescens]|uniref:ABC transporter permease n=1 Tax=Virgibacillus flavescens TaxID=1611422 RepID=UPI003D348B57
MILQIIKKQLFIFLRNPQLLLLLIGLPIILSAILGASLGNLMNGGSVSLDAKVVIIEHGNEADQVEKFLQDVEKSQIPEEIQFAIKNNAEQYKLIESLKDIVGSEGLKEIITLETVAESEKEAILKDDSYAAVLEIPENFTYNTLQNAILNQDEAGELKLYKNEGKQVGATVISEIVEQFQQQLALLSFSVENGLSSEAIQVDTNAILGESTTIDQKKPISARDYYAVGMAVMNVLFVASMIGSFAFQEKKIHVFNRVILANISRWVYFSGIFISGVIFGFLHLLIVFGASWILFGIGWPNLLGFFIVTFGLAIAVGGLSVLLTAISFRINSEIITNYFSSVVVSIIAFLGGSFFPIGDFSKIIQSIGNLTPNGAGMSAYLALLRGDDIPVILDQFFFLSLFALVLVIIAGLSFPKRGYTL